jgi:hypothetical protein
LLSFARAVFSATQTTFVGTQFRGTTVFSEAAFDGAAATVLFDKVTFDGEAGGHAIFGGAKFTNRSTVFSRPRVWKNVSFDWDFSPDDMPACIRPKDWPPALLSQE